MKLAVDIGNTRMKWALFDGDSIVRMSEAGCVLPDVRVGTAIVCATGKSDEALLGINADNVMMLSSATRLPITIDYATPESLGPDRIAAACGAYRLCGNRGCVVVDAGTCITVDFIDGNGVYYGGAILPGIEIKFRSLHTFTEKLPLLTPSDYECRIVMGQSTRDSMLAGVITATQYAVEGFVSHYRRLLPDVCVLLTGGAANYIWDEGDLTEVGGKREPNLVMIGLNEIMKENE